MKENKAKKLILEQLRKMPVISVACERTGVSRASLYRWKAKSKEFAEQVEKAIAEGEAMITDLSEAQLIALIRDKNFQSLHLWLKHHHPKYANKLEVTGNLNIKKEPLSKEQEEMLQKAAELQGLLFDKKTGQKNEQQ